MQIADIQLKTTNCRVSETISVGILNHIVPVKWALSCCNPKSCSCPVILFLLPLSSFLLPLTSNSMEISLFLLAASDFFLFSLWLAPFNTWQPWSEIFRQRHLKSIEGSTQTDESTAEFFEWSISFAEVCKHWRAKWSVISISAFLRQCVRISQADLATKAQNC